MKSGVPSNHDSPLSEHPAASGPPVGDRLTPGRGPLTRTGRNTFRAGLPLLGMLSTLIFTSSALAAAASVGLGTAAPFSVLGGSTVTNTGPTTMFGNLGLSPGSSVTGAPHVLGETHVDDAVAIAAKNDLISAEELATGLGEEVVFHDAKDPLPPSRPAVSGTHFAVPSDDGAAAPHSTLAP